MAAAFDSAAERQQSGLDRWRRTSLTIGAFAPRSLLYVSVQELGRLDAVLRCMEDERRDSVSSSDQGMRGFTEQMTLSGLWVGSAYEILRVVHERDREREPSGFGTLFLDMTLLRVSLEKYQLANDWGLTAPLPMRAIQADPNEEIETGNYDAKDPSRTHIMPAGLNVPTGSCSWLATDAKPPAQSRWLVRRNLSERFLEVWG